MAIFTKATEKKETKNVVKASKENVNVKFATWMLDLVLGDDTQKACDMLKEVYANSANDPQYVADLSVGVSLYLTKHLGALKAAALFQSVVIAAEETEKEEVEEEETEKKPVKKARTVKK